MLLGHLRLFFFFFNDTATTEIYTLSLHDALPICSWATRALKLWQDPGPREHYAVAWSLYGCFLKSDRIKIMSRSEEHTSELQSRQYLVCRLLLEKKKYIRNI